MAIFLIFIQKISVKITIGLKYHQNDLIIGSFKIFYKNLLVKKIAYTFIFFFIISYVFYKSMKNVFKILYLI